VYPDPRVSEFIKENFVPVRVHVREQPEEFKRLGARYGAQWTPTTLVIAPAGEERHRIEGFLPVEDFLAQLALGLAKSAFARGQFDEGERRFRSIVDTYPHSDAAPEAMYWAGVSRYKGTGDAAALKETGRQFRERFTDTPWAKKASVWSG
jgi:TolA-binding protein